MSEAPDDPFTVANQAIWDALLAFQPFADLLRVGNRLSSTARPGFSPVNKRAGAPADYGEVKVVEAGHHLRPFGSNSKISEATQTYDVHLTTDVLTAVPLNRLKWNAMRALARTAELGRPDFIRDWTIDPATESTAVTDDDRRGREGWAAAFAVNVEMYWDRKTL